MCSFKSGVPVYKSLTEVTLYTIKGEDSHTVIKEKYNIPDDFSRDGMRHCTAEYKPGANSSLCDPESNNWLDWEFVFDSERPNWWNEEHTKSAICQLRKAVLSEWENGNRHYAGDFYAPSYNHPLPEGFTCGGSFHAKGYHGTVKGYRKFLANKQSRRYRERQGGEAALAMPNILWLPPKLK